jgi:hypothetical protein
MSNQARKDMEKALKEYFTPQIREVGFKGFFPHFRRQSPDQLDLLSFQFFSSGGSFIIEIGCCEKEGLTNSIGKLTPANKVNVGKVWPRLRLGSTPETNQNDHWFKFNNLNYETQETHEFEHYKKVANNAASFLHQAENWWALNKSKH